MKDKSSKTSKTTDRITNKTTDKTSDLSKTDRQSLSIEEMHNEETKSGSTSSEFVVSHDKENDPAPQETVQKSESQPPIEEITPVIQKFGEWLKEQRQKKNVNLEEIAAVTKVHIQQLRSLEEDNQKNLPAPAFVRGFLVTYSRHLGLNEEDVLSRYKAAYGSLTPIADILKGSRSRSNSSSTNITPPTNTTSKLSIKQAPGLKEIEKPGMNFLNLKNILLLTTALVVMALIGTLVTMGKKDTAIHPSAQSSKIVADVTSEESPEESPKVEVAPLGEPAANETPTTTSTAAAAPPTSPANTLNTASPATTVTATKKVESSNLAKAPTTAETPKKFKGELRAIESTWVNVRSDNSNPRGVLINSNKSIPIEANERITLVISNAANVEIRWNGVWYSPPGKRGEVKSLTLPDDIESLTIKPPPPRRPPPVVAPTADPASTEATTAPTSTEP